MYSAPTQLFKCQVEEPESYIQYLNGTFSVGEEEISLGGHKFYKTIFLEEIDFVLSYIKKQWIFIQNIVLLDNIVPFTEIVQARQDINKVLQSTLDCVYRYKFSNEVLKTINSLASSVLPFGSFDDEIITKICFSRKSNINCPIYEYFHCYLEIQFYTLLLRIKCKASRNIIEDNIQRIMTDIILISRKHFVKECNIEKTSFGCPCIKHFWKILQIVTLENYNCDIFWDKLTIVLKNDNPLFSLWMLRDLTLVHDKEKFSPNYNFIKDKLKLAMTESDDLLKHLKLIYSFVCELCSNENRVEILLLLWEHYSKRLNTSTKYKKGQYITCTEFTESLDIIILSTKDCNEEFEFFIGLLINYLGQQPKHWGKIKCRIFSQLSPFKIASLGEVGIYRVLQLFIALTQVNQEEMDRKIVAVFDNLKEETITTTVINLYISFIIRHVRQNQSIEKIAGPLLKILQNSSENHNNFRLIKEFLNGFNQIIQHSNNMQLQQWILLDNWIIKYLATCYLTDLEAAVKTLLFVVKKINSEDAWSNWNNVFQKNVYTVLKQIGNLSTCPPLIGELVGEICILSSDLLNESFNFFTSEILMFNVTEKYLCTVLKNYPTSFSLTQQQEKLAIQSWIRIGLYSSQNSDEITKNIMKLESIPSCLKENMNKSSDPLVTFIKSLGKNKNLFLRSPELCRFCEMCFENLDKSFDVHLNQIKNESVVLRIYVCLALTFLECGNLLYNSHKTTSPMVKLLTYLLFPTEFMMGKIVHPFLNVVRQTYNVFFQGLLKLNTGNDAYIQRCLRDLISKYLPHYSVAESPLFKCLAWENGANVILEKMSSIYFKHPTRENELNVTKALKILKEYVKSTTSADLLKIVVIQTFFGLCEVYIFQSQKNLALSIIMDVATCSFYDELKDEIIKSLLALTEKHLAFNTKAYFDLINILAKTIPHEISILKESIIEKIKNVERIRGIGHDDNLRSCLNSLNSALRY